VTAGEPDYTGHDQEDGIRGAVGQRFGQALAAAAEARGFVAAIPGMFPGSWVSQPWQGRELVIGPSPVGGQAMSTGYRWIAVRLSTTKRLGVWANPPSLAGDPSLGVGLALGPPTPTPTGIYADDPRLLEAVARFAVRVVPPGFPFRRDVTDAWVRLHARNDALIWHLRAQRLDGPLLIEALDLLVAFARYAETFDERLAARLGEASGVTRHRNVERVVIGIVLAVVLAGLALFALAALTSS